MTTSSARQDDGRIVSGSTGGMSGRPIGRRRSVDSIPALVIHPPQTGSTPPRPPRSPRRPKLPDIKEEPSSAPKTGGSDPALQELTSLRDAVQEFVRRLQAIPPPESSTGSGTSSTPSSTLERLRRVRSMSSVGSQDELDRRRMASGATFGAESLSGTRHQRQDTSGTDTSQEQTGPVPAVDSAGPSTPLLPPSNGHSPISPLALSGLPLPQVSGSATPAIVGISAVPPSLPSLHVTRPSTSDNNTEVQPFAAVVTMMERGDSPSRRRSRGPSPTPSSQSGTATLKANMPSMEGRSQTPRRGMIGPKGLIAKVKSSSSLSKAKKATAAVQDRSRPASLAPRVEQQSSGTTFLRPAPLPPPSSTYPARFAQTEYARSNASSPSPSPGPEASFARASPSFRTSNKRSTRNGLEGHTGEMVEIPRFKRKELNLDLVKRRGPGQRIAWVSLWVIWLTNALAGLFFDVNLMYMLVQCTTHTTRDNGPSRSWAFATSAYAIAWGISTFAVWLGWEVYYEFWRKWRQNRPAIEPIYTSMPASLHLSLWSYSHLTFLVHVRLSSWSTPFKSDILPETAYALVQLFPGLLPLLPRAGIGIVLLTTFSSSTIRTDKDQRFFTTAGDLTSYARGVILAFVSVVALRLLVFLAASIILFATSARLPVWRTYRGLHHTETPSTPKRRRHSSIQPRDPATTRSPQKTWYEAETSFGWDTWRSRMRSRIQDTYELCMIRRGGTGIGMMVDGSYLVVGAPSPSPGPGPDIRLVERSFGASGPGSIEELTEQGHNDPEKRMTKEAADDMLGTPTTASALLSHAQIRPNNSGPPTLHPQSSLSSREQHNAQGRPAMTANASSAFTGSGLYAPSLQASQSSHDVFYTPTQGNTPLTGTTPTVERTGMTLGESPLATPVPSSVLLRGLTDPSRGTLPARPESDVMGNKEMLEDVPRVSHDPGTEESITDDSAALLSSTSRRESTTNSDGSHGHDRSRSQSISSPSHGESRPPSRDRAVSAAISRSRAGSVSSIGQTLTRARSSSISMLREGAGAVQGVVRRTRSGTSDGNPYARVDGDSTPHTVPRRRSKLGLGGASPEKPVANEK